MVFKIITGIKGLALKGGKILTIDFNRSTYDISSAILCIEPLKVYSSLATSNYSTLSSHREKSFFCLFKVLYSLFTNVF